MAGAAPHEAHDNHHHHPNGGVQFSNSFESEQTRVPGEGNGALGNPPGPTQQRKSSKDYSHTDEWGMWLSPEARRPALAPPPAHKC